MGEVMVGMAAMVEMVLEVEMAAMVAMAAKAVKGDAVVQMVVEMASTASVHSNRQIH